MTIDLVESEFYPFGQSKQPPLRESIPYITSGTRIQFRSLRLQARNWLHSCRRLISAQKDSCVIIVAQSAPNGNFYLLIMALGGSGRSF